MRFEDSLSQKLSFLYEDADISELLNRIQDLIEKHGFEGQQSSTPTKKWDHKDAILITYGDTILPPNGTENKLETLECFVNERLGNAISGIHLLPFCPYSSDDGFSVIDYREVDATNGTWDDIERLSEKYDIMGDLVINHASRYSDWFENYQIREQPGRDYFIEVEPGTDVSEVTRPRSTPLLSTARTADGLKYVWTTFSDDQIDLDFSNPEVLLEFIDIFLFYVSKGIKIIRLDAIAYLWKELGTKSIHLEQTHQVVKLFRDIADFIGPDVTLITETNVPFEENISYFGDGDEAHMIYQFSLPPLLLHAILTENGEYLTDWAENLPDIPEGCTYFNFTASHDGIGVRPLEGLVPDEEFDYLIEGAKERGGFVSYKENTDGSQSPYELNITYFDAFEEPGNPRSELQIKRYLCSQMIMLSLQGVPGIYIHNFLATRNFHEGVAETGEKRTINRREWNIKEIEKILDDDTSTAHKVLSRLKNVLQRRKKHAAFSPESTQKVLHLDNSFFGIIRGNQETGDEVLCISNLSSGQQNIPKNKLPGKYSRASTLKNVLGEQKKSADPNFKLEPFETVWLTL